MREDITDRDWSTFGKPAKISEHAVSSIEAFHDDQPITP
jgi:hypothetical protein